MLRSAGGDWNGVLTSPKIHFVRLPLPLAMINAHENTSSNIKASCFMCDFLSLESAGYGLVAADRDL